MPRVLGVGGPGAAADDRTRGRAYAAPRPAATAPPIAAPTPAPSRALPNVSAPAWLRKRGNLRVGVLPAGLTS